MKNAKGKAGECITKHDPKQLCYGCVSKYENPDARCGHPPARNEEKKTWSPVGYCWGYAHAVDKGTVKKFVEESCPGCELWATPPRQGAA